MNRAGDDVRESGASVPGAQGRPRVQDSWADLRPVARWIRRRHPVSVAAVLLVAADVAWRAQFLSHMYFFREDFFNLDLASESPFTWHYLTYIGSGHLMIGERAIIWVLARISLYDWGMARAVTLAFVAAAGLAAFRLLRTLFGERPAILAPLGIYLFSPLSVAALGWWTAALETVPFQLAMFLALTAHLHYVRTARPRHLATAVTWVVLGLVAFEKGLVLPLLMFAVTAVLLAGREPLLPAIRLAVTRYARAWLSYGAVLAGYMAVLLVALRSSAGQPGLPPSLGAVVTFSWNLVKGTLAPGALGGPWRWWLPLPGRGDALAAPPHALQWLSLAVVAVVVGASILRRRVAWRAWAIFAGWIVLADMAPVVVSRLAWYPVLLALETRYVADAPAVLAICLGLAFVRLPDVAPSRAPVATEKAGPPAAWPRRWLWPLTACLLAVVAAGSVWSAQAYRSVTTGATAAAYIASARQAIRLAPAGTPVEDASPPPEVAYQAADSGVSRVIGDLAPGRLRWIRSPARSVDGLRMFGPDGRLYPAWVFGTASGPPPAPSKCWPQRQGRIVVVFPRAAPYFTTVVRIGYIWGAQAPGVVHVSYGAAVRRLRVLPGLHAGYVAVAGTATSVTVSGLGGARMCVGDTEAGNFGPVLPVKRQS